MSALADKIEKRIREIPVHGSGYMALYPEYPEYLFSVLSRELIRKIAEAAADEATKFKESQ